MAPIEIGISISRYVAKKSATIAVALFVALAAVPVLADAAHERVSGLSSETATAVAKEAMRPVTPASLQPSQELKQETYQQRFIRRLSGDLSAGVGRKTSQDKEATQSGTPASLLVSQEQEQGTYQERFIRRLGGDLSAGVARKTSQAKEATQSETPAFLQVSREQEQGTYQERFIRRLGGATFPRAHSKQ